MAKSPSMPAPAVHTEKRSRPHVIVGCKFAGPWLELQLCAERTISEQTQTGPRDVKMFFRTGNLVRIRGTAYPEGKVPEGFPERPRLYNGAVLNEGVPADFWYEWVKQNARNPLVTNKIVFAFEDEASVRDFAKEHAEILSGLEPVNPRNDARLPKPMNASLTHFGSFEGQPG